eukprot:TRINITY_DN39046_c0_g3_i1.p1 TRINITY_DN39046_c0_g3~~TRINITY_DN39046_c0_g3_i1.p1  ORF type:complete len:476 (-),score=81.89 TRINITY_DN39046_c0_g3_i1:109-1536(-)
MWSFVDYCETLARVHHPLRSFLYSRMQRCHFILLLGAVFLGLVVPGLIGLVLHTTVQHQGIVHLLVKSPQQTAPSFTRQGDSISSLSLNGALERVRQMAPLPLVIKNPFKIQEGIPPYIPEDVKPGWSVEEYILNYEETNQLPEKFRISVEEEWFNFDPLPYTIEACYESRTLCRALQILFDLKKGRQQFMNGSRRIPKVIHQTVRKLNDPSQPFVKMSIGSFSNLNSGYVYLMWTDQDVDALMKFCFPHLESLFHLLPINVMKADLFRYLVVLKFGGVYADADTICLKSIDSWLEIDSLTELNGKALQSEPGEIDSLFGVESDMIFLFKNEPGRNIDHLFYPHPIGVGQFAFAGSSSSAVIRDIVANTTRNLMYIMSLSTVDLAIARRELKNVLVLKTTGPGVVSNVVHDHLQRFCGLHWSDLKNLVEPFSARSIRIHPITAFGNLFDGGCMGQKTPGDPQALVHHLGAGSWKS